MSTTRTYLVPKLDRLSLTPESIIASVSRFTLSQAVPHLLKLFINTDEVSNRPSILLLLSDLIAASRDSVAKLPPTDTEEPNVPLMPYKDQVLGIVTTGLKTTSSRRPALACLVGLVSTHHLLSEEEVGFIVHNVNEILEADPDEVDDARYEGFPPCRSYLHSVCTLVKRFSNCCQRLRYLHPAI